MAPQDSLTAILPCARTTEPTAPLLRVDGLSVFYGANKVVTDVGFALGRGKSLALIGESGSGKSTIVRAVLRLLPEGAHATGRVAFDGQEVLGLSERRFRPLRGRAIGFVPLDPGNALNPVRTIGAQAMEAAALLDLPDKAGRTEITDVGPRYVQRVSERLLGGEHAALDPFC